jgi:hypothetical protein
MDPLLFAKWDIKVEDSSGENVHVTTSELTRKLNQYKNILEHSHRVLIERQLPINYQSTLIMQHVSSYFEILLADKKELPIICLVDPQLKSRVLAKRKKMTKPELKAWSPGEAIKWLQRQNDDWSVDIIESSKKKDDYADVIVMREAYYQHMKSDFATPFEVSDAFEAPKLVNKTTNTDPSTENKIYNPKTGNWVKNTKSNRTKIENRK